MYAMRLSNKKTEKKYFYIQKIIENIFLSKKKEINKKYKKYKFHTE